VQGPPPHTPECPAFSAPPQQAQSHQAQQAQQPPHTPECPAFSAPPQQAQAHQSPLPQQAQQPLPAPRTPPKADAVAPVAKMPAAKPNTPPDKADLSDEVDLPDEAADEGFMPFGDMDKEVTFDEADETFGAEPELPEEMMDAEPAPSRVEALSEAAGTLSGAPEDAAAAPKAAEVPAGEAVTAGSKDETLALIHHLQSLTSSLPDRERFIFMRSDIKYKINKIINTFNTLDKKNGDKNA
jgi:hypothetical protein